MAKKSAKQKLWEITRNKMQDQVHNTIFVNGKVFKYACNCKEHSYKCVTEDMWDALEDELDTRK